MLVATSMFFFFLYGGPLVGQRWFEIESKFQYFEIDFVTKSPRLFQFHK